MSEVRAGLEEKHKVMQANPSIFKPFDKFRAGYQPEIIQFESNCAFLARLNGERKELAARKPNQ